MVRVGDFEFGLTEFAGALGDFGPLNPFLIAYIAVLGLNPFGVLFAMGITNIAAGLIYRLPLPVEPQKAVGVAALEGRWGPSQIYGIGIGMGLVWLFLAFSGAIRKIAKVVPICVIVGVQFGLALILLRESLEFMWANVLLAVVGILLVILLIRNKYLPAGIAIFALGLAFVFATNPSLRLKFDLYLPEIFIPSAHDIGVGLLTVGIAQIVLTLSNAVLATCLAVNRKFPHQRLKEESLAKNVGLMNTCLPLIGGVPMCHGAGGFAAQYFFGARTGGAMLMEGIVEIVMAFFLAESVAEVFGLFPLPIIGAMLLFASLELGKFILTIRRKFEVCLAVTIGAISFLTNLGVGFFSGLALYYIYKISMKGSHH